MTTTDNSSIEFAALLSRMQHWEDHAEDREDVCVKCGEFSGNNQPEHEPSPLCNSCAQDLATRTFPDQLEAAQRELDRLIAAQPNWSHAEALSQRAAMIAANVQAQAECARLRAELDQFRGRAKRIDEGERRVLADYDEVVAERDALRARVDPVELHRTVHQAAFYELDMGATWKVERVKEFAERIAKHVVDVWARDLTEFTDGGKPGRRQPGPHATQQGAATPGQEATAESAVPAAGNVAEPQLGPTDHRAEHPPSDFPEVAAADLTDDDLKEVESRYADSTPKRPCSVCGACDWSLQAFGGGRETWACRKSLAEHHGGPAGSKQDWAHYSASRREQASGDSRIAALLAEVRRRRAAVPAAGAQDAEAKLRHMTATTHVHGEHAFVITATDERGLHTGRRRYRVECRSCSLLVHPASTSVQEQIDYHLRNPKVACPEPESP